MVLKNIFWCGLVTLTAYTSFSHPLNDDARHEIESSIKEPGYLSQALSGMFSRMAFYTPSLIGWGIDHAGSAVLSSVLSSSFTHNQIKKYAFTSDDKVFAQYDDIIGVHRVVPKNPVSKDRLYALINSAKSERHLWEKGRMSGGVYDGSVEHMKRVSEIYEKTLQRDEGMGFLPGDVEAKALAVLAFEYFHTSNPLHGAVFALSVKAMREMSSMLASLIDKEHAIISSGAKEALRIGLRALKNRQKNHDCLILAGSEHDELLVEVAKTINAQVVKDARVRNIGFAAYVLDQQPVEDLARFLSDAKKSGLDVHVHLSERAFRSLFDNKASLLIVLKSQALASVSYATDGVIYQGISATVFANAKRRFDALESHIDWLGGVYPGINSAGSLPGIDYILAYLGALHNGLVGLEQLAKMPQPALAKDKALEHSFYTRDEIKRRLINMFDQGLPAHKMLDQARPCFSQADWRNFIEEMLVALNLSIFKADPSVFNGKITSGGTESIRQAVQLYHNRFKALNPSLRPIFLMTNTAHIAFDRHMKDLDSTIIRIAKNIDQSMDVGNLEDVIDHVGKDRIAGIIISTPNYPVGAVDNVREIAEIAHKKGIPLHVDACLGAFILQFIHSPYALSLDDPEFLGVTSWSADLHKYGITQKGLSNFNYLASFARYRGPSPEICALRTSSQIEVGLISMLEVGRRGYEQRAQRITELGARLCGELSNILGLEVLWSPIDAPRFLIAFRMSGALKGLTYTMGKLMEKLGWHLSSVNEHILHIAITSAHTGNDQFLPKFVDDLQWVVNLLRQHPNMKQSSSVGLYGMAADMSAVSLISGEKSKKAFLANMVKLYADNLLTVK